MLNWNGSVSAVRTAVAAFLLIICNFYPWNEGRVYNELNPYFYIAVSRLQSALGLIIHIFFPNRRLWSFVEHTLAALASQVDHLLKERNSQHQTFNRRKTSNLFSFRFLKALFTPTAIWIDDVNGFVVGVLCLCANKYHYIYSGKTGQTWQ